MRISIGNGIAIKVNSQTILLDPNVSDYISFVSHSHSDHIPSTIIKKPYCTEETYELAKIRNPNFEANIIKEDKRIKFDDFSVRLISSGHMLGATQIFIEVDGNSILYTGDFKIWQGLTTKPIKIQHADVLITEATYGNPIFKFPPIEDIREEIVKWVTKELENGYFVNLGTYASGKSQEVIKLLNLSGITPQVSETIRKYSNVYKKFGVNLEFLENGEESKTFIKSMHVIPSIKNKMSKSCVLTGWSLFRDYGVKGFPLSDHCDFDQILSFIQKVNPKQVFCVHGYSKQLAKEIKKKLNIVALPLSKHGQKSLVEF